MLQEANTAINVNKKWYLNVIFKTGDSKIISLTNAKSCNLQLFSSENSINTACKNNNKLKIG